MKIQLKNTQFSITLPKKVVEGMGWKKGDKVEVRIAGKDKLELVRG